MQQWLVNSKQLVSPTFHKVVLSIQYNNSHTLIAGQVGIYREEYHVVGTLVCTLHCSVNLQWSQTSWPHSVKSVHIREPELTPSDHARVRKRKQRATALEEPSLYQRTLFSIFFPDVCSEGIIYTVGRSDRYSRSLPVMVWVVQWFSHITSGCAQPK